MSNPFIRAIAAAADRFLQRMWPANAAAEFAEAAFNAFEADRDCLAPGELTEWSAGAVARPSDATPLAAPAGTPNEFDDLPTLHGMAARVTDDDIEWISDFGYLEALADHILDNAYNDRITPQPIPWPDQDTPKDIA